MFRKVMRIPWRAASRRLYLQQTFPAASQHIWNTNILPLSGLEIFFKLGYDFNLKHSWACDNLWMLRHATTRQCDKIYVFIMFAPRNQNGYLTHYLEVVWQVTLVWPYFKTVSNCRNNCDRMTRRPSCMVYQNHPMSDLMEQDDL